MQAYTDHNARKLPKPARAVVDQTDLETTIRAGIEAHKRAEFEREMVRAQAGMTVVEHAMPERGSYLWVVR